MGRYSAPAMDAIADVARNHPSRIERLRQIDRAERLAAKVAATDQGGSNQYDMVRLSRQVTQSHAIGANGPGEPELLTGREAFSDLRQFVEDVSAKTIIDAEDLPEPVWTIPDLGERFHVSTKTIERWRTKGLMSRRYRIAGRNRIGFRESSVREFIRQHRNEIERGRRFSQLSDRERADIIFHARRLSRHGVCTTQIAHRLAETFQRSHETIRYTIQQHDQQNPGEAVFPKSTAPLTPEQKQDIYQKHRRGVSLERLGKQFHRAASTIQRIIGQVRAERLLSPRIDFMDSPEFHLRNAEKEIFGPPPETKKKSSAVRPPAGLPPYLASLYAIPLLTREEEQYWFRKMNYLKFRAAGLQESINPKRPRQADLNKLEALAGEATEIKNFLIRSNLRLVVSIAKKHIKPTNNFFEMVSDGNMSLIRAIEKFDYTKGNKFSTYATWAIMKNFARSIPTEHKRLDRFRTGKEEVFQHSTEHRSSQFAEELTNRQQNRILLGVLDKLDHRERDIVKFRFGLGNENEPLTLEQVGVRFGVTKERIRQLESRALKKARKIVEEEKLDIPGLE